MCNCSYVLPHRFLLLIHHTYTGLDEMISNSRNPPHVDSGVQISGCTNHEHQILFPLTGGETKIYPVRREGAAEISEKKSWEKSLSQA